jgi:hypothetical protein
MVVRLSALYIGRLLLPGGFLVLISVTDWVGLRAIVKLAGRIMGIEKITFQFAAQCLN